MAINWDLYNTRLNVNGSTKRERDLNGVKSALTTQLPDSLSCKTVTINGIEKSLELDKTTNGFIKEIHSLPNETFECGDYVVYNGKTYLIIEIDNDKEVYTSGKMQECNFTLKFQSPDGTILSCPCITATKSFNQDETKMLTLPSNQKSIWLQYNDNTKLLDTDRRLFVDRLNKKPYKVIGSPDNTSFSYGDKGLIYFVVEQDELQDDDRPDLGVCDYKEPNVTITPPVGYSYATITCSGDLIVGGITRTITPTFYNADSTITTDITVVWDIDLPIGYENQFTITYLGNQVKINVAENYDLIGKVVTFNAMGSNGGFGGSITLTITV
jgi:hypothetical protein